MSKQFFLLAGVSSLTLFAGIACAAPGDPPADGAAPSGAEVVVTADRAGLLEKRPSSTVLGLNKPLIDTPRAATAVSAVTIERYGIQTINDLVAVSPRTYTASFYGVPGSLDIRGTFADNYFQGFKLIENTGHLHHPHRRRVADRDRPRAAVADLRAGQGRRLPELHAQVGQERKPDATGWRDRRHGGQLRQEERHRPGRRADQARLGGRRRLRLRRGRAISAASTEASIRSTQLGEVSVNFDLPNDWAFFADGLIYHSTGDVQTPGWNRLTQDLIDNQTYITGHNTTLMNTPGVPYLTPAQTCRLAR